MKKTLLRPKIEKVLKQTEKKTVDSNTINFGGINVFVEKEIVEIKKPVEIKQNTYCKFEKGDPNNIKISEEFKNLPSKTNICCWYCTEHFETHPISLPIHEKQSNKQLIYHGIFCSWNCCKAFSMGQNDSRIGIRNDFINSIIRKNYGKHIHVYCAPSRYRLNKFGGDLDLEQFRKQQYLNKNEAIDIKITPFTLSSIKIM